MEFYENTCFRAILHPFTMLICLQLPNIQVFATFLLSTLYFMFISCRGVVLCRFWFLDLFSFFALIIHCFGTRWRPRSRRGSCHVSHNGYTSREPPKTQNKDHGVRAANFVWSLKPDPTIFAFLV